MKKTIDEVKEKFTQHKSFSDAFVLSLIFAAGAFFTYVILDAYDIPTNVYTRTSVLGVSMIGFVVMLLLNTSYNSKE